MPAEGYEWGEAYGKVLGTICVAFLAEFFLSFVPPVALRRIFPPVVTGTAVFLIGASLIGTGIKCALARASHSTLPVLSNAGLLLLLQPPDFAAVVRSQLSWRHTVTHQTIAEG